MVKVHVFTDRSLRYDKRCTKKNFQELRSCVTKNEKEYSYLYTYYNNVISSLNFVKQRLEQSTHSYNFLYSQYSHLYEDNRSLKTELDEAQTKLKNNTENYNKLKESYDELLEEFVEEEIQN